MKSIEKTKMYRLTNNYVLKNEGGVIAPLTTTDFTRSPEG